MNRKKRRSQNKPTTTSDDEDVPLAHPPSNPQLPAKTLYEIAAERQAALTAQQQQKASSSSSIATTTGTSISTSPPVASQTTVVEPTITAQNTINVTIAPDGSIKPLTPVDNTQLLGIADENTDILADSVMLAASLSALHFTLEALTLHQYAEELNWTTVFAHSVFMAFPVLLLLTHFAHGHLISVKLGGTGKRVLEVVRQVAFVGLANVAGCYLVYLTNDKGYMAVMKNAPSIGTLWVWAVIELGLAGALAGVAGPGAFAWYYGYGIF